MLKINFTEIDNALKYYNINDINYKNKCYKCIEDLNSIYDFNNKSEEIYNILYTDKSYKNTYTYWRKIGIRKSFRFN